MAKRLSVLSLVVICDGVDRSVCLSLDLAFSRALVMSVSG